MLVGINNKTYNINLMSKSNLRWIRKQMKKPTTTLNYVAGRTWYMRVPVMWNYIAKQRMLVRTKERLDMLSKA